MKSFLLVAITIMISTVAFSAFGVNMKKILFVTLREFSVCAAITGLLGSSAYADDISALPRIGVLMPILASAPEEGLLQGLRKLGYAEGRNIHI